MKRRNLRISTMKVHHNKLIMLNARSSAKMNELIANPTGPPAWFPETRVCKTKQCVHVNCRELVAAAGIHLLPRCTETEFLISAPPLRQPNNLGIQVIYE